MNSTPKTKPDPKNRPPLQAWLAALLVLATVGVYLDSFSGVFVFDDIPAIVQNPTLRAPVNLAAVLAPPGDEAGTVGGRPMLNLSLAINYLCGGLGPFGYHAFNLTVHVGAALILFALLGRALRRVGARLPANRWSPREIELIAFFAALLWAVHPLQTEAVTYVVQRAESLMGLFYLLTLYCFERHAEAVEARAGRKFWAALTVLACLLGMATKEVMVSAPLAVLLYDRTLVAGTLRDAWRRRRWLYVALAATWVPLAIFVASTHGRGGSAGFTTVAAVGPYLLTQGKAVAHYLRLAVWPNPLVFDYGTALVSRPGEVIGPLLLLAALGAATVQALRKHPAFGFLGFCFFAILAPSSSVIPIATEPMAEHRMYLPLAAVAIAAVVAAFAALKKLTPRFARAGLCLLGAAAATALGASTVARNRDYRSEVALWTDTVRKVPDNPRAHNNLAEALRAAGQPVRAVAEFAAAVRVDPGYAPAQYDLGATLLDAGHPADAIPHLERALSAPRHQAELHRFLGEAFERTGHHTAAVRHYRAALRLAPGDVEAAFGLGNNLAAGGHYAEAVAALRVAVAGAPDQVRIRNNLANALLFSGRVDEAIGEYREALRRDPSNAAIRENLDRALQCQTAGRGAP